jgi:pyruvate carboxylase
MQQLRKCSRYMASTYSRHNDYLGDLVVTSPVAKASPEAAQLLVSMDIARQAALSNQSKWRMIAVILSGGVIAYAVSKNRRWI